MRSNELAEVEGEIEGARRRREEAQEGSEILRLGIEGEGGEGGETWWLE